MVTLSLKDLLFMHFLLLLVLFCATLCNTTPTRDNPTFDERQRSSQRSGKAIISGSGSAAKDTTTLLELQNLERYSLAKCADGSTAGYYVEQRKDIPRKVMIHLGDENSRQNPCSSVEECLFICNMEPSRCKSPESKNLRKHGGIWSKDDVNNPFADYFKVYIPECSLDQFSGTRGPLQNGAATSRAIGQKQMFFHGRHIFSSVLRHLVSNYKINKAEDIILIGSGNSASGVSRNCDFLADAIKTVNSRTRVRCVLDGPTDFNPFWIQDIMNNTSSSCGKTVKQVSEDTKFLWGRRDDESCLEKLKDNLNSTSLAEYCGIFSRSWQHVSTPMFIITSQWNGKKFDEITCNLDPEKDQNYGAYVTAWRRGMLGVIQAMSDEKPENGWFIPNCGTDGGSIFLSSDKPSNEEAQRLKRKNVRIPLFAKPEDKRNLLQVLNSWVNSNGVVEDHQAIDILGFPNPSCSSDDDSDEGSNKLRSSLNLDLRPELILSAEEENPLIASSALGGSDFLPLPSPDDLFAVDPVFSTRSPTTVGIEIAERPVVLDTSIPSVQNVRPIDRRPANSLPSTTKNAYSDYIGKPGSISHLTDAETAKIFGSVGTTPLHSIEEKLRANMLQRKRLERQFYLDSVADTTIESNGDILRTTKMTDLDRAKILQSTENTRLRKIEASLAANILERKKLERLLKAYKLSYPVSSNSIKEYSYYPGYYSFDNGTPSPKVTTTSDLDLDLLLRYYGNNNNYNNFYYPTVLPEAAIKVSNYNSRKARLWRKVYYLEYLRELYRRAYREYYRDYYYGT